MRSPACNSRSTITAVQRRRDHCRQNMSQRRRVIRLKIIDAPGRDCECKSRCQASERFDRIVPITGHFSVWRDAFLNVVQEPETAAPLKAASLAEDLKSWTACLTAAVVTSCRQLGWLAAAKGHRLDELPQAGQEYLSIDVMAFPTRNVVGPCGAGVSPAVLEQSDRDDAIKPDDTAGGTPTPQTTRRRAGETPAPQARGRWRLPVAAFELENHLSDDRVA